MALTATTLSAAVGVNDDTVLLASITGLAVGEFLLVNNSEVMKVTSVPAAATSPVGVIRGQAGTRQQAHATTSKVSFGEGSDFGSGIPGASTTAPYSNQRGREVESYTADATITNPTPGSDMVAILNGTAALAMTVAVPAADNDGDIMWIVGNGKAAHTVTFTGGLGNAGASYDVATFDANGQNAIEVIAANGRWVLLSPMTGTLTAAVPAIA